MKRTTHKQRLTSRDIADLNDLFNLNEELNNFGEKYDHYENKYFYEAFNDGYHYKTPTTLSSAIKRRTFAKKSGSTKRKPSKRTTSAKKRPSTTKKPATSTTRKKGRVIKASKRQTGTSSKADKSRKAMSPGKRKSRTGRTYYEYRKNRTDVRGRKT